MSRVITVQAGKNKTGKTVVKRAEDITLNGLNNVRIDNPQNLDVLVFHQETGKWIARPDSDIRDLANANIDCGLYDELTTTIFDGGEY